MKFKRWDLIGILLILGNSVFLYYAKDILKFDALLSLIVPKTASLWEYLKLTFYAILCFIAFEYIVIGSQNKNFVFVKVISLFITLFLLSILYLGYTALIAQNLFINIGIFILAITIGQLVSYLLFNYKFYISGFNYLSTLALIISILIFCYYSYEPGSSKLFQEMIKLSL